MKIFYKSLVLSMAVALSLLSGSTELRAQGNEKPVLTNQEKTITIYPVPANSYATVRLSPALRNEVDKVEIVNLIGRKMSEQVIMNKQTTEISFTNLNELPQGIYIVVARDKFGKIVQSAKMVVNR